MYHPLFEEWKKENPSTSSGQVLEKPDYFVSANDLTPLEHAQVQAASQKYIDASISKTVNAPSSHTVEDVKTLYMAAYDLGLKGVTYMRDGSREGVLTRVEDKKTEEVKPEILPSRGDKPVVPRPMQLEGVTYQIQTPVGKTYITINHNENREPFEVFITIGKSGSDVAAMADALGRTISLNLRLLGGLSPREKIRQVVAQLAGIGGARSVGFGKDKVRSLPDGVAKILAMHFGFAVNGQVEDKSLPAGKAGTESNGHIQPQVFTNGNGSFNKKTEIKMENEETSEVVEMQQLALVGKGSGVIAEDNSLHEMGGTSLYDLCPECGGGSLAYEEGCRKCYSCGYAEC